MALYRGQAPLGKAATYRGHAKLAKWKAGKGRGKWLVWVFMGSCFLGVSFLGGSAASPLPSPAFVVARGGQGGKRHGLA